MWAIPVIALIVLVAATAAKERVVTEVVTIPPTRTLSTIILNPPAVCMAEPKIALVVNRLKARQPVTRKQMADAFEMAFTYTACKELAKALNTVSEFKWGKDWKRPGV